MVFWQSPRTRKQAVAGQQVRTVRRLPSGDYTVSMGGKLIVSVERKSLADLVSSLTSARAALRPRRVRCATASRGRRRVVCHPADCRRRSGAHHLLGDVGLEGLGRAVPGWMINGVKTCFSQVAANVGIAGQA